MVVPLGRDDLEGWIFGMVNWDKFVRCFWEVHRSNMSKFEGASYRDDGKLMKGPNYSRADLSFLTEKLESYV